MSLIERAIDQLGRPLRNVPQQELHRDAVPAAQGPAAQAAPPGTMAPSPAGPAQPAAPSAQPTATAGESEAPRARAPAARNDVVRIDWARLAAQGFVPQDAAGSSIANEFRVIKRPLLVNAFGRDRAPLPNGRRVMLTSANPADGKSFCALNLALSIASERDHRVLLVDADVARPSLPDLVGFEPGRGLMDLIIEPEGDTERYVRPTSIDKLSILSAGHPYGNATELLASADTERVLRSLTERYPDRLVIFDSPPVLASPESRVLAPLMGQIVIVVAAGATPREAVNEVLSLLEPAPVVGFIFNKSREPADAFGYGYGYGYGYSNPQRRG